MAGSCRTYFVLALLCAALLLSCRKEPVAIGVPEGTEANVTSVLRYRATAGQGPQTKASINGLNQYIFETGDQLYVVDAATSGTQMYGILNLVAGAGDPTGTFEGDLMCLGGFSPENSTVLSATLVSRYDKIHTCEDAKVASKDYPDSGAVAYASGFSDAIRSFSDFTAENTFSSHAFSLEQHSTFLTFSITFNEVEAGIIGAADSIYATLTNNGSILREGPVCVSSVDLADQANFVAAFEASTNLDGAEISFKTLGGTAICSFDDITDATLLANRYYEISRSNVSLQYFTIQARETGTTRITFSYSGNGLEYNTNGSGWNTYDGSQIELSQGGYVQFRDLASPYNTYKGLENETRPLFTSEGDKACFIYGDIMSLLGNSTSLAANAFQYTFRGMTFIDIPAGRPLRLTASSLGKLCYNQMFWGCTSLTRPPELQTTLTADVPQQAYAYMFKGCTSLLSAPHLQEGRAVGLGGYEAMFQGCTALITVPASIAGTSGKQACQYMFDGCSTMANAPALPSATVGEKGYYRMFRNCTGLVAAPDLPAESIGPNCYQEMFIGCTSLVDGPEALPATILSAACYNKMFEGCLALSNVPEVLPATSSTSSCYQRMFYGCISLNTAPEIKLENIEANSCNQMFYGCTSLVTSEGPKYATSVATNGCYQMYANCGELTTTPAELLSATLPKSAYYQMYYNCAKITAAPDIEATVVDTMSCYQMFANCRRLRKSPDTLKVADVTYRALKGMFQGCNSLASAPVFSAMSTVRVEGCMDMFNGCTNLKTAPALPATNLFTSAYENMFKASGITAVPSLLATELAERCYMSMFLNCKYLEGPAVLPAPTLVSKCYSNMFDGASMFDSVVCLATDHSATDCTYKWLRGVSSSGTFVRPNGVVWTTNAESGIPTGWTVQDSGLDPIFPDDGPFDPEEDL